MIQRCLGVIGLSAGLALFLSAWKFISVNQQVDTFLWVLFIFTSIALTIVDWRSRRSQAVNSEKMPTGI